VSTFNETGLLLALTDVVLGQIELHPDDREKIEGARDRVRKEVEEAIELRKEIAKFVEDVV